MIKKGRNRLAVVGICSGLLLMHGSVSAESYHKLTRIQPIKRGEKIVGARLHVTLFPSTHTHARLLLGDPNNNVGQHDEATFRKLVPGTSTYPCYYAVTQRQAKYILHQTELFDIHSLQPMDVSFDILYGKGNSLKGGETVDLVSVWPESEDRMHIYGMTRYKMNGDSTVLPQ